LSDNISHRPKLPSCAPNKGIVLRHALATDLDVDHGSARADNWALKQREDLGAVARLGWANGCDSSATPSDHHQRVLVQLRPESQRKSGSPQLLSPYACVSDYLILTGRQLHGVPEPDR
jgi:hypothetical protein